MRSRIFIGSIVLTVLIAFAPDRQADEPRVAGLGSEIEVRLVNLEVFVSDGDGQPVHGLTSDEFIVEQDGQALEITHFSAIEGDLKRADAKTLAFPDTSTDPLHLAIVIANDDLQPGDLHDMLVPLGNFLRQTLGND